MAFAQLALGQISSLRLNANPAQLRDLVRLREERLATSKSEISNLQHSLEAMRAESLTDPLTGLGNRKYFDRMIETAVQTSLANNEPLSLLMVDIDHSSRSTIPTAISRATRCCGWSASR